MRITTAAELMGASVPRAVRPGEEIAGFAIDSRAVAPGELFFAFSPEDYARHCFTGTNFADAHVFLPQALTSGAIAAVARRARVEGDANLQRIAGDRLLLVDDVIAALQHLARGVLDAWARPVVAIGGSAGKTTTKDLTAHVLAASGRRVLKSHKNYNNEIGLPLSILQMETKNARPENYDVAILEMGVSLPGEIKRLCQVAPPDVAVELCVAPEHLEFLGTIERVAEAEGEIIENVKPNGTAILNADDELVIAMRAKHGGRALTFGLEHQADIRATEIESVRLNLTRFTLHTPYGTARAELPLPGRHNLMNALAAAAVASVYEIGADDIARALASAAASEMRGEVLEFADGFTIIDDTYNSNPRSLVGVARTLSEARVLSATNGDSPSSRRLIVAGEMLELGPESNNMHRAAGREIAGLGVDVLWVVGGEGARAIIEGAREGGMSREALRFFASSEEAAQAFAEEIRAHDTALVKGSRGVRMDKVIKVLRERYELKI